MAKVSPYADPSAHGKLTPGLCFKRRGRIVQLGKCPRPKDKRSAAQIAQREKITQAVAKYKILNNEELIFLRRRGTMLSKTSYSLYTSSQLIGNDWSKEHGHQLQVINNMVIFDLIQTQLEEIRFSLISSNTKDILNNIKLYAKLDSETTGVVSSTNGPDFDWEGVDDHAPLKFNNGAFGNANTDLLNAQDNGQFYKDILDNHYFSMWLKLSYDVIDGKPQDTKTHVIFEYKGQTVSGKATQIQAVFSPTRGLYISFVINGILTFFESTDSNITFESGDVRFYSFAYVKDGIDEGTQTLKMYFGTDTVINEIGSYTSTYNSSLAPAERFTLLSNTLKSAGLKGGLDNIKIIKITKQNEIDELNNTRNIEEFETELGYVFDNENIFFPEGSVTEIPELILKVENFGALPWAVPFYWLLAVTWSNLTNDNRTTNIRFPKTEIDSGTAVLFYLSRDMSLYFDNNLIKLGATSNV